MDVKGKIILISQLIFIKKKTWYFLYFQKCYTRIYWFVSVPFFHNDRLILFNILCTILSEEISINNIKETRFFHIWLTRESLFFKLILLRDKEYAWYLLDISVFFTLLPFSPNQGKMDEKCYTKVEWVSVFWILMSPILNCVQLLSPSCFGYK